jgi:signal transduction histidine kinase
VSRVARFLRSSGRVVRRIVLGGNPPPLRSTLFRVVFAAVLVPVLLTVWSNWQNRDSGDTLMNEFEAEFDPEFGFASRFGEGGPAMPENVAMPESDYKEIKEIIRAPQVGMSGGVWPPTQEQIATFAGLELPDSAYGQLIAKRYAYGEAREVDGDRVRFAVWYVPQGFGVNGSWPESETASYTMVVAASRGVGGALLLGLFEALMVCLLVGAIASPAAWYLERRIARPVNRVAQASRVLAEGGHPLPVPSKGPAELFTLTDTFNDMAFKLRKAEAAEREFLLSVSHELKTPLTVIEGYAELLTDGAATATQAGPALANEAGRLRRLVDDLLDLARINQSAFAVRDEQVDLGVVAREVVRRHAAQAKELGVLLTAESCEAGRVWGDEDRLVQAISNLVENALRCLPSGGAVTVAARPGEVIVRDDGLGLAAEDVPHAFERFYLHNRLKSDRDVGSGLGLAIVKDLVEKMGGAVSVVSELGKGATFRLELRPVREAQTSC